MTAFADVPEQVEAKRLLEASLADGQAHGFLFHGPRGVGKRTAARAFAGVLLGDRRRVDAGTHPDLRVIVGMNRRDEEGKVDRDAAGLVAEDPVGLFGPA